MMKPKEIEAHYANEPSRDCGWYWVLCHGEWYAVRYDVYTSEAIEEYCFDEHPDADAYIPVLAYGWQSPNVREDDQISIFADSDIDKVGPRIVPPHD